jgi:adenylate cyclase
MPEDSGSARPTETRKLAAIMFTDIVGFSRQMGADEARMLRLLEIHNQIIQQAVAEHHGHVIKSTGDGFLVDFPSVVHAVQCAQQIQARFRVHNAEKEPAAQIHIRIGIHLGDIVVQQDGDVQGDGVNIAARLQPLAEPDTICISQKVYEEVEKKLALGAVIPLGKPKLKNIAQRFGVYLLLPERSKGLRQRLQAQCLKLSRRISTASRVVLVGLVLIAATAVVVRYLSLSNPNTQHLTPSTQALPLPDKPSIVVLPFANMSNDPEQDYFSDGLTEDLTSDLSRIDSLFVIARNSAFTYKGKAVKVQDVGREMGVRYVLEGSVRRADNQVRISAQLIDTTTGGHLWSEHYDRPLQDIFALQDEIVQKIVTTLKLQLTLREQGILVRKTTDNLEAYDSFLRGMESFLRLTKEANVQARQMYEKAIALDPQYVTAYVGLGTTYLTEWSWHWSPDPQTLERAFELAQKAVALDDSLPGAHGLLSWVYMMKQQPDQAMAEGERAIALDPNFADSYARLAEVLNSMWRSEEALQSVEQAMRLNPRYPAWYSFELGTAYFMTGRYAEAIPVLKQVVLRSPNFLYAYISLATNYCLQWTFQLSQDPQILEQAVVLAQKAIALNDSTPWAHMTLGYVYLCQKQYDRAIAEGERAVALDPHEAGTYASLASMLSWAGRPDEALRSAEQAMRLNPSYAGTYNLGGAYFLTGRYEEAIAYLQKFLRHRPTFLYTHLTLAAAYSELGRETEARTEAAEVLRLNPHYSLEVMRQREPIKDPAVLELCLAA